jgi:hypothetical protein
MKTSRIVLLISLSLLYAELPSSAADKSLLAHWTFDGKSASVCEDASGNKNSASMPGKIDRIPGVSGTAIGLAGGHKLSIAGKPDFSQTKEITMSAWVLPTDLSSYREIFRKEDGNNRVLFSFQNNGTILSLGLNINGYIECDAALNPATVLDAKWHHCSATFDGKTMRVYLDGKEIESLYRSGTIKAGGSAPGCIGSMNGGECFQGAMDDLRIYNRALSDKEIAELATQNIKELPAKSKATLAKLGTIKPAGQIPGRPTPKRAPGTVTAALIDDICIYLPLTDLQWKNLSPEEEKKWKEVADIKKTFEKLSGKPQDDETAQEMILLGNRIEALNINNTRPRAESPAPHVNNPITPETRTLTADEAKAVLQQDWLYQVGKPNKHHLKSEIKRARELAERIDANFDKELAELAELDKEPPKTQTAVNELYFKIREIKRRIMFKNPVVDFSKVVFVDMPFPAGREWNHETKHRLGYMAVPGARLQILDGLSPAGELKQLMPQKPLHGAFWRPDVSWDGEKILFCYQPHNEKSYHIYEINADPSTGSGQAGMGLRQITKGPYDDLDPIYLPDGKHIMFSSTRGHTYVRCMPPTSAYVLTRCDLDGNNIYIVSRNNEPDYLPTVMNDGRIIYTRWEYTDKPLWRAQGLWTVNPDGTQVNTLWGNQSVWPDLLKDARSIPGSQKIMFVGAGHHQWFDGSVGIIDPNKGFNYPDGLTKVTAEIRWAEVGNGPIHNVESPNYHHSGNYKAYYSPYPLSEKDFLVSARRNDKSRKLDNKFVLYLMDVDGNREIIYEGHHNIFHAMPVKARKKPPVRPDMVKWPTKEERLNPKDGVIFSNNVYEGMPEEVKGKVKYMRILSIDAKTYTYWHKRPQLSTGPVVSAVQSEGVKRILGTVPVERDGSVSFNAPSGLPLHFQLLDDKFRALQTMRSFTGVMPGERRGCVGCHESRSNAPQGVTRTIAASRKPSDITPPPWKDLTVSWDRYVRPVLDKHCAECHQGDGKARKTLDLTPKKGWMGWDATYSLFIGKPSWGQAYRKPANPPPGFGIADMIMVEGYSQTDPKAYQTPEPMTKLSYKSRLVEIVSGNHPPSKDGKIPKVKVDEVSRRRIIAWIDAMAPYRGEEEVREIPDPVFPGVDWLAVRPRVKTAPRIVRPGPMD